MIVNQTTFNESNTDFIRAQLRKQPIVIILRIVLLIFYAYMLVVAGLGFYAHFRWHDQKTSDIILYSFFLVWGIFLLYQNIFVKQITRRGDRKYRSFFAPRTYTIDENGITVQYSVNGVGADSHYSFENAECYWGVEGESYLRVVGIEKKQKLYICLHDDGYIKGSREELITLLESKGIRKMK